MFIQPRFQGVLPSHRRLPDIKKARSPGDEVDVHILQNLVETCRSRVPSCHQVPMNGFQTLHLSIVTLAVNSSSVKSDEMFNF